MDITHHYIEVGEGEPLILLHGNGENSGYFSNQIEAFSKLRHVIALDTRGHGQTPRGSAPFTIRQFADDLAEFMDAHDISAADLLGFSDGANIAMLFAIKYPARVKKLILNGGNLDPGGVRKSVQIPIEIGYRFAHLFANKSARARANAELLNLMVNDPNIAVSELRSISSETLVIAGTRDMITEKHTRLIAENLPHSRLVFIEGDHFIASKNPSGFNQAVTEFLER